MPLKLMYITNDPALGRTALEAGVDRLFVDMEYISKAERQRGRDTVLNHHTVADVARMRACIDAVPDIRAELLVRCNPWRGAHSSAEINAVIAAGADAVMLPYFKTLDEAACFLETIEGRTRCVLLLETPEAVEMLDDLLMLRGIDEIYIGLNDLSIGYGRRFLFELLADGTVERLCRRIGAVGIPYGFGGVAAVGEGILPAEYILAEHQRLGSSSVILSRSFSLSVEPDRLPAVFGARVRRLREREEECRQWTAAELAANAARVRAIVAGVCGWGTLPAFASTILPVGAGVGSAEEGCPV